MDEIMLQAKVDEVKKSIVDKVQPIEAKVDETEKSITSLNAQIFEMNQKLANFSAPAPRNEKTAYAEQLAKMLVDKKEIKSAATGLGQNGTGGVQVISEIIRGMVDKNKFSRLTRPFWGDNKDVNIPVFLPGMAMPTGGVEGDSGKSMDSAAALGAITLTPYEFFAGLEISRLATYTTSLEASLGDIFDDAFGQAWEYQILNGTGNYQFTGVYDATWVAAVAAAYPSNIVTTASATAITWKELATLARRLRAKAQGTEKLALILHPDIISALLSATGASPALELEYLTKGSIGNVPVIESTHAPDTVTAGLYTACACDLNKYATAWIRDFTVDQVKVKGTSNIYNQGFVYANGKPLDKSSFFYLQQKA
jgi:HK97 family phage major capsid protein